jgi:hypothetical protein
LSERTFGCLLSVQLDGRVSAEWASTEPPHTRGKPKWTCVLIAVGALGVRTLYQSAPTDRRYRTQAAELRCIAPEVHRAFHRLDDVFDILPLLTREIHESSFPYCLALYRVSQRRCTTAFACPACCGSVPRLDGVDDLPRLGHPSNASDVIIRTKSDDLVEVDRPLLLHAARCHGQL